MRPYAEKLITHAKKGTLHNRREVLKKIRDKDVVHKLFAEIGPFFADRDGGYTRIIKVEARKGDNAPMAVIQLVREKTATSEADRARRVAATQAKAKQAKPDKAEEIKPVEAAEETKPVEEVEETKPAEEVEETTAAEEAEETKPAEEASTEPAEEASTDEPDGAAEN